MVPLVAGVPTVPTKTRAPVVWSQRSGPKHVRLWFGPNGPNQNTCVCGLVPTARTKTRLESRFCNKVVWTTFCLWLLLFRLQASWCWTQTTRWWSRSGRCTCTLSYHALSYHAANNQMMVEERQMSVHLCTWFMPPVFKQACCQPLIRKKEAHIITDVLGTAVETDEGVR